MIGNYLAGFGGSSSQVALPSGRRPECAGTASTRDPRHTAAHSKVCIFPQSALFSTSRGGGSERSGSVLVESALWGRPKGEICRRFASDPSGAHYVRAPPTPLDPFVEIMFWRAPTAKSKAGPTGHPSSHALRDRLLAAKAKAGPLRAIWVGLRPTAALGRLT